MTAQTLRARLRGEHIPRPYSGWLHFGVTTTGALAAIIFAAWQVNTPSWAEWLTVVATLLFANLAEYRVHRGPMHRRAKRLPLLYERHSLAHHRFYTHDAMTAESSRDFYMVLFPPWAVALVLVMVAPIGGLLLVIAGPNIGWLFVATAMGYFLSYEWLHFSYHLPEDGFIGRRALVRWLRRHHQLHHDPRLMGRYNFNVTFPICDHLFGTAYRGPRGVVGTRRGLV